MRKLMLAALATSAALAAAAPAAAQTTTGQPFTGFRVEGLIGYDSLNDRQGKDNSSSDGVLYGAGIGYDIPAGPVILGAEGDGLAQETIAECDYTVRIPMTHDVDSLNVAAAAAVAFWELRK